MRILSTCPEIKENSWTQAPLSVVKAQNLAQNLLTMGRWHTHLTMLPQTGKIRKHFNNKCPSEEDKAKIWLWEQRIIVVSVSVADMQLSPHLAAEENTSSLLRTREKTGRNYSRVRKGSGRPVSTCLHPRYYLYLGRSSGTDVTHHLSSLFPGSATLTESHAASDTITLPSPPCTVVVHRRRCCFTVTFSF